MRVLIVVTHLLGVGHLTRAAALAEAFAGAGHRVMLVSGGQAQPQHMPSRGVDVRQLPAVHAVGADFVNLRTGTGAPVTAQDLAQRANALAKAYAEWLPDCVITETFPFGRNSLRQEFEMLINLVERSAPRPVMLASIRDILNPPSRPHKAERAQALVLAHYGGVLVHGDAAVAPLAASWPVGPRLEPFLHYTGYVLRARPDGAMVLPAGGIVVSGGGGMAALPLFRAGVDAARLSPDLSWRILVGAGVPDAALADLCRRAPANAIVERARPDFRALLAAARLSVSQAGYNTMGDLASAGTPALLVPFEEGGEQEQRLRAEGWAANGKALLVDAAGLGGATLLAAVRQGLTDLPRRPPDAAPDGANMAVRIAEAAVQRRDAAQAAEDALVRRLDAMAAQGETMDVWWRDDDAADDTPQLRQLLALRQRFGVPLALAISPGLAQPGLTALLAGHTGISALMHGLEHRNNAPPGRRKQELGFVDADSLSDALAGGLARHLGRMPAIALPVMVPPWNRIDDTIRKRLHAIGISGISTYGQRVGDVVDGLLVHNTHLDIIDWRAGKRVADEALLLQRLAELARRGEPIGLLSHHLVHDGATWRLLARLLGVLARHPAVRFCGAAQLWSKP